MFLEGQTLIKVEAQVSLVYLRFESKSIVSRLKIVDLVFLYFLFSFFFSIFRTLWLGVEEIGHTVTSVTSDDIVTASVIGLKRRK